MANEISINVTLGVTNGTFRDSFSRAFSTNQANPGGPSPGYVEIGTTEEEIDFAELGTPGFVVLQNIDDTNYIEWGFATTVYGGKLMPGDTAGPFRLNGLSIFAKANTAACGMLIKAYEA